MDIVWFDDPQELIRSDNLMQFWPSKSQSPEERINSATRFIIYSALISFALRKDHRVFILSLIIIGSLFIMYKNGMVEAAESPLVSSKTKYKPNCQLPTLDNPMANVLLSDITDNPSRSPACYYPTVKNMVKTYLDDTVYYDSGRSRSPLPQYQRSFTSRQFVSQPVSTVPGAQTEFAEWLYGKKNAPICRSDQSMCSPNSRGVQLEAFGGLDSSGTARFT